MLRKSIIYLYIGVFFLSCLSGSDYIGYFGYSADAYKQEDSFYSLRAKATKNTLEIKFFEENSMTKSSSAGIIDRYRELWMQLCRGEISEYDFLTEVNVWDLAEISDFIVESPHERVILHRYLSRKLLDDSMAKYNEILKMYNAFLTPEKDNSEASIARFMRMVNPEKFRKRALLVTLIYAARNSTGGRKLLQETIDSHILTQTKGDRIHITERDIRLIKRLSRSGNVGSGTRNSGALNRLLKRGEIHFSDQAATGLLNWVAKGLYPEEGRNRVVPQQMEMDIFHQNMAKVLIDKAA